MTADYGPTGTNFMDLNKLLDVIQNADVYRKRMEELREQEQKIIKATAELTKATNLDEALQSAKRLEESAKTTVQNAKDEANKILESSKSYVANAMAEFDGVRSSLELDIAAKKKDLGGLETLISEAKKELDDVTESVRTRKSEAEKIKLESEALREEINKKREILRAL